MPPSLWAVLLSPGTLADHPPPCPLLIRRRTDNSGTNREYGIPDALWEVLGGHRWYVTSLDGLRGIVYTGSIDIRPGHESLCRSLGAISLFDFGHSSEDVKSLGHWSEWCGSQQASRARLAGIPEKRVGVWLRVRDGYIDERVIDACELRRVWKKNLANRIIPGVEGGHVGPLAIAELNQVVAVSAVRMDEFGAWGGVPSAAIVDEVARFVENMPAEPLSHFEQVAARVRAERDRHLGPHADPRPRGTTSR